MQIPGELSLHADAAAYIQKDLSSEPHPDHDHDLTQLESHPVCLDRFMVRLALLPILNNIISPLAFRDMPFWDYSVIAIRLVSCLPFRKLSHFFQIIDDRDQTYGRGA